ncbi:MAG: hypothetical protein AB7O57_04225 [Hyphomicrobiaceae bacterium]
MSVVDECRDCPTIIRERDEAQDWADDLADLIAAITGTDIGEHSNLNNPWERAVEAAEAYLKQRTERPRTLGAERTER